MVAREDWLWAGLGILAVEGAPGLTIERLTDRMRLSKGSFYHHFKGTGGFRTALLTYFEARYTTRLVDIVEAAGHRTNSAKLRHLLELVLTDPDGVDLEIAVRAWALQDAEARAAQTRVDTTRTEYLETLCTGLTEDAARLARLLYLILVGAEQVLPPMPRDELREVYAVTLRMATGKSLFDTPGLEEA